MKKVRTSADITKAIEARMKRDGLNPFSLAHRLAPTLKVTPHAVDNRLRRMIAKQSIDIDFAAAVCREIGLKITVGDAT